MTYKDFDGLLSIESQLFGEWISEFLWTLIGSYYLYNIKIIE
jgi:hypothetical protein